MAAGTCQNEAEDVCATSCPARAADTLEDINDADKDAVQGSRTLLSFSDDRPGDRAFLWHIHSTLTASSPSTELFLGPIDAAHSIGSPQGLSGTVNICSCCSLSIIRSKTDTNRSEHPGHAITYP